MEIEAVRTCIDGIGLVEIVVLHSNAMRFDAHLTIFIKSLCYSVNYRWHKAKKMQFDGCRGGDYDLTLTAQMNPCTLLW